MKTTKGLRPLALALAALGALPGRAAEKPKRVPAADAVATIGDVRITAAQFEEKARGRLLPLKAQEYEIGSQILDEMIAELLLQKEAAARRATVEELLRKEVEDKVAPVEEAEARAVYERVKARFAGRPEADLMADIQTSLRQQRIQERRAELVKELRTRAAVRVLLEPPRVAIDTGAGPARGPKEAPVTVVEFSDFQCPYCGRVMPTLKQLEQRYGDQMRLFFRDFPLPMHPLAPKAAEAAKCASEQGRFWEMHDRLFADQGKLQVADLKQHAVDLGLDGERFNQCLDSGRHEADWRRDASEGERYGVSGTPAFFINGRFVSGARPLDAFVRIIDDELQRAGLPVPPSTPSPAPPASAPAPPVAPASPGAPAPPTTPDTPGQPPTPDTPSPPPKT